MIICHYDDTNPSGGLEKQARLLSRTLQEQGEDIVMLASTRKLARAGWDRGQSVPVRFFWTYHSPQLSGRYLPAALIWAFQLLIWIGLHRKRIDAIHCHQIRIHAFVAALARKFFGIPVILKSATGGAGADIKAIGSRKYFGAWGRDFIIRNTDRFVATTASVAQDLRNYNVPSDKITVIPNGLAMVNGAGAAPETRMRRALFLGRIARDKNAVALARAAQDAFAETGMALDFYGDGTSLPELLALLASKPDLPVRYCGFVDEPHAILPEYGFLFLPSNAEGLSNAMLEAMAQGVIPVTTRVSGCVDHIVPGQTGFFLEGVGRSALMEGFRLAARLPPDSWSDMSGAARRHARSNFKIESVAEAYQAMYQPLRTGDTA